MAIKGGEREKGSKEMAKSADWHSGTLGHGLSSHPQDDDRSARASKAPGDDRNKRGRGPREPARNWLSPERRTAISLLAANADPLQLHYLLIALTAGGTPRPFLL